MIPTITPPTDNLYKFLSLFGLTIFLFSSYNLGIVYDKSSTCKIKNEEEKTEIQLASFEKMKSITSAFDNETERFRPSKLKELDKDLSEIKKVIFKIKNLSLLKKIKFRGKISKLKIEIDALKLKSLTYGIITFIGFLVMVFGFFRWNKREQVLRDGILKLDHLFKERQQEDSYRKYLDERSI